MIPTDFILTFRSSKILTLIFSNTAIPNLSPLQKYLYKIENIFNSYLYFVINFDQN